MPIDGADDSPASRILNSSINQPGSLYSSVEFNVWNIRNLLNFNMLLKGGWLSIVWPRFTAIHGNHVGQDIGMNFGPALSKKIDVNLQYRSQFSSPALEFVTHIR